MLITCAGFVIYILGVMIGFFRIFLDPHGHWIQIVDRIIWHSGEPFSSISIATRFVSPIPTPWHGIR
jgi:hypothetical protein